MKTRIACAALGAMMALILNACGPASGAPFADPTAPKPALINVGVLGYVSNSPLVIAQVEGFYAEQGLDVEIVNFGTSDREMLPALLGGQLDVAATVLNVAVLNGILGGIHARFVADKAFINPNASCATDGWVARKALLEAGTLEDLANLEGKKLAFTPINTAELAADVLLERAGLSQDDIEIIDMIDQTTRVQALASAEPWITRARTTGSSDLWMPLSELIPNYSIGTIIYGPSMLERDPDVGTRFMVAYLKAIHQFSQGKTDRNVELVADFTKLAAEEVREICWPSYQPDGKINEEAMRDFLQWALEKGYIVSALSVDQIWDPRFVEAAYAILSK